MSSLYKTICLSVKTLQDILAISRYTIRRLPNAEFTGCALTLQLQIRFHIVFAGKQAPSALIWLPGIATIAFEDSQRQ